MADNPTLARFANQMPEATGVAWNFLSDAPLYTATELLFYGAGMVVTTTLPNVVLSSATTLSLASDVATTWQNVSLTSQTIESYPPDVFMFLPNVTLSSTTTEALPPGSVSTSIGVSLSSESSLGIGNTVSTLFPNIAMSVDATSVEPAEVDGTVYTQIPAFSLSSDTEQAVALYADVGTNILVELSSSTIAVELPTYVSSIPRALVDTVVSRVHIRTKVEQ